MIITPFPSTHHILSLAQTFRGGGVESALLRLSGGWCEAGRRVTLLVGCAQGPLARDLHPRVELIEIGSDAFRSLARLPAIVRQVAPDLIFIPGNHYTSIAALTRARLGRASPPIVAKVSNALARRDQSLPIAFGYRWWLRRHAGFVDHFVAMTEAMRGETIALTGADPGSVSVIANPPPIRRTGAADPVPPAPSDGPLLVGVGRLEEQKRWDRAIAALARIADRKARLIILGEGSQRARLEAQIAALGLSGRVALPGYVADPTPYLSRAAALLLTSDFEGVPGVIREALAVGTPVVATDSSVALREIVADPTHGTIVPVNALAALVAAIDHWLSPAAARPDPVPLPGLNAAQDYLALFDRIVSRRPYGAYRSGWAAATASSADAAASAATNFG